MKHNQWTLETVTSLNGIPNSAFPLYEQLLSNLALALLGLLSVRFSKSPSFSIPDTCSEETLFPPFVIPPLFLLLSYFMILELILLLFLLAGLAGKLQTALQWVTGFNGHTDNHLNYISRTDGPDRFKGVTLPAFTVHQEGLYVSAYICLRLPPPRGWTIATD